MGKRSKKNRKHARAAGVRPANATAEKRSDRGETEALAQQVVAAVIDQIGAVIEPAEPARESGSQPIAPRNATESAPDDAPDTERTLPAKAEKRTYPRVSLAVDINFGSESHFFAGLSGDISEGGVFVQTYRDIPVGSAVDLEFSLPEEGPVTAHGSVRWHRDASDSSPPGVGIEFDELPDEKKAVIHAFCRKREPLYYEVEQAS